MSYQEAAPAWRERFGGMLDRAENIYLRILRAMILVIATLLIFYTAWLLVSSIYKMSRSPDSVEEEVASVQASELTDAEMPTAPTVTEPGKRVASPEQQRFYQDFVSRYFDLFRNRFEPFRQPDDKRLSRDEFDDTFVNSAERLEAIAKGDVDFSSEAQDLRNLLATMTEAAEQPKTQERLRRYQKARKVRVANNVQRTRTEYRRGWDSYSTACANWYESPIGCAVSRSVAVPYTETVYSMEFPKGTQSHAQIFQAFQNRYLELLQDRRDTNARQAEDQRNSILAGKLEGELSLSTALYVFGTFLMLMFFFLLIAIERHQRRMSASMPAR
jgi:hypothetical protein